MLTHKQRETLKFIKDYIQTNQESPTVREIAEGINVRSPGVVHRYLAALKEAGQIDLESGRHRNIRLHHNLHSLSTHDSNVSLPIMGRIAAGRPIEAVPDGTLFNFSESLLGDNRFLLEVNGESMLGDNICDGDLIICEYCEKARPGEIAVIVIDDDEVTLKRYYPETKECIRLQPSNPDHPPQYYNAASLKIRGRYLGLLRLK